MRSLLRSITTRLYFEFDDKWVGDITRAHDFGSSARAIQFAVENRLKDIEVVLAYDDPHYDISIPFRTRPTQERSPE